MKFEFKKASKKKAKLRCAIYGPSGAGKTFTALAIAHGMGNKIAVIDTENESASKYANRTEEPIFEFNSLNLIDRSVDQYIRAINLAEKEAVDVLIIDSLSHAWQSVLEEVNKLSQTKFKNNSYAAWSEGTPTQKKLINAIVRFNGHIFCTMRAKTDYVTEAGKKTPTRVGLSPEQGKMIEYEFDLLMEISSDHMVQIIKDRTGKFQDTIIEKPGKEFGLQLLAWLNEGEEVLLITEEQMNRFNELTGLLNIDEEKINAGLKMKGFNNIKDMTHQCAHSWIKSLEERLSSLLIEQAQDV